MIAALQSAACAARTASSVLNSDRVVEIVLTEDGLIIRGRDASRPPRVFRHAVEVDWREFAGHQDRPRNAVALVTDALDRALNA